MGKSTSCFKLITCGSDSAEKDDAIDVPENKGSSDKKGWSFRKRSERHRVLSNSVIQVTTTTGLKESQDSVGFEFQQQDVSVASEQTSTVQYTEEKPQLMTSKEYIEEKSQLVAPKEYTEEKSHSLMPIELAEEKSQLLTPEPEESKVPEPVAATTNEAEDDFSLDESVVVIIQTAIRGFLAQKELGKLKNLVKLQAAVRGHLVRRHAVGTLRCVQAIVKMQLLVRARQSQEGSYVEKKLDGKHQEVNQRLGNSATKKNLTYNSMEKLLSNRFARQLMDSTPKTKTIHFKCDSSQPSSAWSWLERWMSVSSSEKASKAELTIEQTEQKKSEDCDSPRTPAVPSEDISASNEPKPHVRETMVSSESEENLITYDAANFKFEACQPSSSSVTDDSEQSQIDNAITSDLKETSPELNSQGQPMQINAHSQIEVHCLSNRPETESEQPKHSMERFASEHLETEAKKIVFGSKRTSNPAFIAAQTKFEELSSTANSSRSIDSSYEDVRVESNLDTVPSGADMISRSKEPSITQNLVLSNWRVQHGGSECGTELSITSTLDSPDRSEAGTLEYENATKVSEQENCTSKSTKDLGVKNNDTIAIPVPDSSLPVVHQPEKLDDSKGGLANLIVADCPQVEQKPLKSTSNLQREQDPKKNQAYRSSPEVSPRSHMTVPESQGTPSSEVSVKAKKKKTDKSSKKRKSLSAAKGSPSTPAASTMEELPKDQKNGKRRNSFSSTRPENINEEPRDSNSSNPLPRFMQATEAARAKVNTNNSPRSSPDVQDRDIYINKRHSLPGANGRQGSPRIQRSLSQAQQGAKRNGTNPTQDGKGEGLSGVPRHSTLQIEKYYSMYGHVEKLAEVIKKGAASVEGVEGKLWRVPETLSGEILGKMNAPPKSDVLIITPHDLAEADGFIFGFPTRFGMMSAQFKAFMDATGGLWRTQKLAGKPAGIFYSTRSRGGGQETTPLTAITQLVHHGMIFVPIGYSFGAGMFEMEQVKGGSPYGAGTYAGDGTRMPSELELAQAFHQVEVHCRNHKETQDSCCLNSND